MSVEGLPYLELLSPLIFVLATIYVLSPALPLSHSWARALVFIVVWLVVARYFSWRFFSTVLPADGDWYEVGWVYFCFAVEALALFDAFILYLAFLRTSDRRAEADAHEARLRTVEKTMCSVLTTPTSTPGCSMMAGALGSKRSVKPRASVT